MSCPDEDTIVASTEGSISAPGQVEREQPVETPVLPSSGERSRAALAPSTRVGRYVVLAEIGEGGMGRVYAAYDPELDRRIALELLRPELAARRDPIMGRARLLREAQAMARLSHPNVLTVHDVGEIDSSILDGEGARSLGTRLVFIAMELVDGKDLRAWMNVRRRSWREVVAAFVQAGEGLAAAHEAGLLHRDFKPDNVLIDDRSHVRVMDFGLARGFDERASNDSGELAIGTSSGSFDRALTHTGAAMGTPPYMPPEQWRQSELDPRADQFAFCVSMWEALYGTRPYRGSPRSPLREAIESGSITPPDGEHSAPVWLRQALERGLSPAPERRHASAWIERRRRWLGSRRPCCCVYSCTETSIPSSPTRCTASATHGSSSVRPRRRSSRSNAPSDCARRRKMRIVLRRSSLWRARSGTPTWTARGP